MRAVNLLPRDAGNQSGFATPEQLPAIVASVLGVAVAGVLALTFMHASGSVHDAEARLRSTEQTLALTPKPPPPVTPPNAELAGEQSARLAAVSNALGARVAWDRILRELSLVLPDDVWLASMSLSNPDPANPTTSGFAITGYTYSHDAVARLLSRLYLVPELISPTLGSSTAPPDGANGTVQFTINAGVQPAPGAAALFPPAPPPPPPTTDESTDASS